MNTKINPKENFDNTMKAIGYVTRKMAKLQDYQRIGFMSGLEVHQQLKTKKKLFCHCPCGVLNKSDNFHAEIIRHMRPTLSELGEYDGTALMEFKTKKNITYRIHNDTTCTYEIDDTPPFPINREALEYALEISLLSKLNIVGEVHITRKQYLDGSIPTGFQRTAILGVEGEIQLSNKKIRLIQLSIEEDSCREISDIGHNRIYKTDRLGMPLIETVTYPEMLTPAELMEAAEYIRFLNRSTGKVITGMGAGREDVNVSCKGGTRVEIKGVSHNKWIPELSHNEAFRQWALLHIKEKLLKTEKNFANWKIEHFELSKAEVIIETPAIETAKKEGYKIVAINLPGFYGILSHFTQPNNSFASEIEYRLKVIACIERPNMLHSEELNEELFNNSNYQKQFEQLRTAFKAKETDAQLIIWGPASDIQTALETIEERCKMAFVAVPNETRRPLPDGTTIFERVLPGADRMYPDTDSAPIPLEDQYIKKLGENLPTDIFIRYQQLKDWDIPSDTYKYLLSKNLVPIIERIVKEFNFSPRFVGTFFGHTLKNIEGKTVQHPNFSYEKVYKMFRFIHTKNLEVGIAKILLPVIYKHPNMLMDSVLDSAKFKRRAKEELLAPIDFLIEKFKEIKFSKRNDVDIQWIMGQIHKQALGNISLSVLKKDIESRIISTEIA